MKNSFRLPLCALIAALSTTVTAGERVGDFALIDNHGAFQHMTWYNDQNAVVILPQSIGATDQTALIGLLDLQTKYTESGVVFFLMNPGLQTDRAAVQADLGSVELPVLMDDAQLVSEMLGLTRLDEAVVYSPKSFEVLYRGPVSEQLEASIQQTLNGDSSELVSIATSGATIEYSNLAAHSDLSYEKDIAPIIAENCANCHREGGIAPFAMDSNLAVQGWSPMIREVVMTKRMPPGQIDNKVGYKMKNEMNLSDDEMQKLVRWVDAGSVV
ncbi:MAG: c-type cytochrome, partial [Pseudohongiella sp.]